jgi:xanthine dehydrogenase accessory factor
VSAPRLCVSRTDDGPMTRFPSDLAAQCRDSGEPFALVTIIGVAGSTPREQGACMVVSAASTAGTIGGGRLEWDAIETARAMLLEKRKSRTISVALGPAVGQCCGGKVTLVLVAGTPADVQRLREQEASQKEARPAVLIHGAGHVGRALASALSLLPFHTRLIDSRAEELKRFGGTGVEIIHTTTPVALAECGPRGAAHVIMTHSHALDSLIAAAVLERGDFSYLGIIGSKTKKALFRKAFRETGIAEEQIRRVICPIGGSAVKDKRPEVIAAMVAAEITVVLLGKIGG